MTNNDVARSLRYTFDFNDFTMIEIIKSGGETVDRELVANWLKRDDEPEFEEMYDKELATFLNGFIILKRGKKEGEQPVAEKRLNNNIILRKLKIALNLRDEDMLAILESVDRKISKHELSAFFRKPGQAQFRPCKDQILRNFLKGLQQKHRPGAS
ncbi:DUF1456 family protein [Algoriphagus persicinus]|uniref:DUF1456 family protein n=1 Tax=Algoriphagus persicinus TaxID=3108754 RepID=UPI002B3EF622|nr:MULTISPECIES: DUF1456 family protein [unclassified Algoriphagus]MEB2781730.1 DUF1456 family protein [Algoriphagus sp. C2-6-M1]MEB2786798.1 DUF1456 family protein [Algoriphagus sp. E1-3-M2]